ncbi:MAG: exosortase/archaeosortase family protein [Rubripirellula sp.]|nr:exosortase/archaeosortase family protein [Rubripirellula sp.]
MSKKKRKKKEAIGRAALRDVQERAVPRPSQYSNTKKHKQSNKGKVAVEASNKSIDRASRSAAKRSEVERVKKRLNPIVPLDELQVSRKAILACLCLLIGSAVYSFWPTLQWAEATWRIEPDYSHGYLVLPLALILIWLRKDTFPGVKQRTQWGGLSLIGFSILMRISSRLLYMDFLDGYSIVFLIAGIVWLLVGLPALKWAAPAIGFLLLLIPLPYKFEHALSWELQGIATTMSTGMLRIIGKPAIAEGHMIWVGETKLMVAQACSGMRIFVGMIALALFWAATVKRCWLDRIILLIAAVPLALFVNSLRITVTGILFGWYETESSHQLIHDWSGYLMIPIAAALLWMIKAYWEQLYLPVNVLSANESLRRTKAHHQERVEV